MSLLKIIQFVFVGVVLLAGIMIIMNFEEEIKPINNILLEKKDFLRKIIKCFPKKYDYKVFQNGKFWILQNYVTPIKTFECYETITLTVHAEYTFLDMLEPLSDRWRGPISLAIYAPGSDFYKALHSILYLRKCGSHLISELVSFHIYFQFDHIPPIIPKINEIMNSSSIECRTDPPWVNITNQSYRKLNKLLYPINLGRNIARNAATTHFILPSDIELYPSVGVIPKFLDLVTRQPIMFLDGCPKVFPIVVFEIMEGYLPPANKAELVPLYRNKTVKPFHMYTCPQCHYIPGLSDWVSSVETDEINVFKIVERKRSSSIWEPFYIGTNEEPYFDERLTYEGRRNKIVQDFVLCLLRYRFHILEHVFFVHKPGIKHFKWSKEEIKRMQETKKTNAFIKQVMIPELKILFGDEEGCSVF